MNEIMPAVFFGHGNPMNALSRNSYTEGWSLFGKSIPRPRAILSLSAHWYIPETAVTLNRAPRTIHDFGGFPRKLYEMTYPAPGNPELARRVVDLLSPHPVRPAEDWGLDHGTWAVLHHVFPAADIPVVQLSIDGTKPPQFHHDTGRMLARLRREGVLLMGSGNLVHNLGAYAWEEPGAEPFDWAARFERRVMEAIEGGDDAALIAYRTLGRDAALSVPTPDHYLPLLYVLGARDRGEKVSFPVAGIDGGSVSMLAVQVG